MIIQEPEEMAFCNRCGQPIEGPRIRWCLVGITLNFHVPCAFATANQIRSNCFNFFKRNGLLR
jgi:hypothetical protein